MADVFHFPEEQFLLIGKVGKPQGLRGEIKVHAFSSEAETLLHYERIVFVDQFGKLSPELRIENSRIQGKTVVLKIESVDDRNRAEALRGMGILIDKEDLQEIAEDEFYWHQFYSLPVHTEEGEYLGSIETIFSNGAQDILVVRDGDKEFLIPMIDNIMKEHSEKGVIISPPPGLLDINSGSGK